MASILLKGRVYDEKGVSLPNANIYVKNNKQKGTTSDLNGGYALDGLFPGNIVICSYTGFAPVQMTVTGNNFEIMGGVVRPVHNHNFVLKEISTGLPEFVVEAKKYTNYLPWVVGVGLLFLFGKK